MSLVGLTVLGTIAALAGGVLAALLVFGVEAVVISRRRSR
jgi:hypothetical protein